MALGPPQPPFNTYLGYVLSSGIKRLELEKNSPSLISAKNEWSCTFTPSVCLNSMRRDTYLISSNTCIICRKNRAEISSFAVRFQIQIIIYQHFHKSNKTAWKLTFLYGILLATGKRQWLHTWFAAASTSSQASFSGKCTLGSFSLAAKINHFIAMNWALLSLIGTGTWTERKE